MVERQQRLAEAILEIPRQERFLLYRCGRVQYAGFERSYSDHSQAARGTQDLGRRSDPPVAGTDGAGIRHRAVHAADPGPDGGRPDQPYPVSVFDDGPDKATLDEWVPKLMQRMSAIPEVRDVASDQLNGGVGFLVQIDRDTAGRFGITPQNIDDALYDSFGQRQVSTIFTQTNQYHVVLETQPNFQQPPTH